ncbi:MAG: histidine-type phosphatase [Lachnospiraceae bacterium]|nr:histidine-type phosphatase [Lachnospiraceae bacterium]
MKLKKTTISIIAISLSTILSGCSISVNGVQVYGPDSSPNVQAEIETRQTDNDENETGQTDNDENETGQTDNNENGYAKTKTSENEHYDDLTLQKVVVLSRHNIRTPLSSTGSTLSEITPHEWISWSADTKELTLKGGIMETFMGQYFKKWLVSEGLIEENHIPEADEMLFYANSKQRTVATAQYFSSGMLPLANVTIEHQSDLEKMDPTFNPAFTFVSDSYIEAVNEQIEEMFLNPQNQDTLNKLEASYHLLEDVVDYTRSTGYTSGAYTDLTTDDIAVEIKKGEEPAMLGSLKLGCQISDALVLQYYESEDAGKASFGKELTFEDWKKISYVKDIYGDILFTTPLVSQNVANPMLKEIQRELQNDERSFSFLCGHDSNIGSVLAAMDVCEYELPDTIERVPIGSKLLFEKWVDSEGRAYGNIRLIYQSTDQIREWTPLSTDCPPASYNFEFKGLSRNQEGLYDYDEMCDLIRKAIDRYDEIVQEYSDDADIAA